MDGMDGGEEMNVLSLFDGMSCGQIALERAGIKVDNYYASEIDKYAIKVTQANYPNTIQLGSVVGLQPPADIDLLIGGSPCQGFSFAGKQLAFDDPRSKLFFEWVRIWQECKPKWWLLENVKMKKEHENVISNILGCKPCRINSALVSAQNRNRLYWTNIPIFRLPEDRKINFGSVKELGAKSNFYYSDKALLWLKRHGERKNKKLRIWEDDKKTEMIEASQHKKYSSQRFFGIPDELGLRYVTPLECERLQTVPDNYTNHVSSTQRYKMLGNGWTVDIIVHFFKHIPLV